MDNDLVLTKLFRQTHNRAEIEKRFKMNTVQSYGTTVLNEARKMLMNYFSGGDEYMFDAPKYVAEMYRVPQTQVNKDVRAIFDILRDYDLGEET